MFRLVHIHEHERGLWFRRGEFQELLLPGSTWLLSWQDRIQIVDVTDPRLEHPMLDLLLENAELRRQVRIVDVDAGQRAVVRVDGRLLTILGPGRHAFWKTGARLGIETFWLDDARAGSTQCITPADDLQFDLSDSLRQLLATRKARQDRALR